MSLFLSISSSLTDLSELFGLFLFLIPIAVLGFIFAKHKDEEPSFLLHIDRMKGLEDGWTPVVVLTAPFIFIFNIFVWVGYAFVVFTSFLAWLFKTIFDFVVKWVVLPIFNAIRWVFVTIFWVPIKIIAKILYHYCLVWMWDLYKTSFFAINHSYNSSRLRIGFIGSFYALMIVGLGIYLSILTDMEFFSLFALGVSILPVLKSVGAITSMIHFNDNRDHNEHGSKVMKSAIRYVLMALVSVAIIQILLYLSLVPDLGLVILGIAISTNVLLSFLSIIAIFISFFAQAIFPNYLLDNDDKISALDSVKSYIHQIKDKGVQLLFSTIPLSLFSVVVLAVPVFLIYLSISVADTSKLKIYENKKESLSEDIITANKDLAVLLNNFDSNNKDSVKLAFEKAIEFDIRSQQISFGNDFPNNLIDKPNSICDTHITSFTSELPQFFENSKLDSFNISENIAEIELLLENLNERFTEFNDQSWSFIVQRRNSKESKDDWVNLKEGTDISRYVDKSVLEGETYLYRVKVKNSNGQSKWSPVITKKIDNSDLVSPSYLRVSSELNFRNVLSWNDNSNNETGFVVERKVEDDDWSIYAEVDSDISQYVDKGIIAGKVYYYRIKSKQKETISVASNIASVDVYLAPSYSLKSTANLKSLLLDWSYKYKFNAFGWTYNNKRKAGSITANEESGFIKNSELSFADEITKMIDEQNKLLTEKNAELEFTINKMQMFDDLINYDNSQRTSLLIFKNISFLFLLIFIALFGGLLLSIYLSYSSNLFYQVFKIRHNQEWFVIKLLNEEKSENNNQPLLGFTLLILFCSFIFYVNNL